MAIPVFTEAGAADPGTVTSGAAWDMACPATVNAGDILIAHISCRDLTTTPTTPSGWTPLTGPHATSVGRHWLYGKIADGSEDGATISFGTQAVAVNRSGRIYRFTGNNYTGQTITNVVLGFAHGAGTTATVSDTGVTTPRTNCLALNFVKVDDNNTIGPFTGMTGGTWAEAVAEVSNNLGTGWMAQLQTAAMASAGTINGGSVAMSAADPWGVIGCYIREPIVPTSTSVARVSLAAGSVPDTRTAHSIKVRARVTGGAGTLKVALYEGANNRSGDLESSALTGSLADYTIAISDANAANITSYADLEIRFWGYSATGDAATFEIDQIWLEIPEASGPATYYGITAMPITFGKAVAASRKTFSQVAMPLSFGEVVSGVRKAYGQTAFPITFAKDVNGQRKAFGQVLFPITFTKDVQGIRVPFTYFGATSLPLSVGIATAGIRQGLTFYGATALPITFTKDVNAQRKTFGQLLSPYIFGQAVAATKQTFGQTALPINVGIATAGFRLGLTLYGSFALPIIFAKDVTGQRRAFGQVALPITFAKETAAQRQTFGQFTLPIIFTKEALGQRDVFGALSMQTLFGKETAGNRKTFGQVALPLLFSKSVDAFKQTFGQIDLPIDFLAYVDGFGFVGPKTLYGEVSFPVMFGKDTVATRKTFGQVTAPYILGSSTQGERRTFGIVDVPLDLLFDTESGTVGTYGQISLPILVSIETDGMVRPMAIILNLAEAIYLGSTPVIAVYTDNQQVWSL